MQLFAFAYFWGELLLSGSLFLFPIGVLFFAFWGILTGCVGFVFFVLCSFFFFFFAWFEAFLFEEAPWVECWPLWSFKLVIICLRLVISVESFEVSFFVSFWTSSFKRTRLTDSFISTSNWAAAVVGTVRFFLTSFLSSNSIILTRCWSRYDSTWEINILITVRRIEFSCKVSTTGVIGSRFRAWEKNDDCEMWLLFGREAIVTTGNCGRGCRSLGLCNVFLRNFNSRNS